MRDFPVERVVTSATTLRVESLTLGVKRIVLSRPDVRNAFDETMIAELRDVLDHLAGIPDSQQMRLLLLEGEGKVFSAGADLGYMKRLSARSEAESFEDARSLARLFYALADFPTPVIAVVQGAAIGGGLGLSVCADYVLADEQSVFATSEVLLGIVPGVISPYIIRKIGLAAAVPMMLTGRRVTADEAQEMGLVQKVTLPSARPQALQNVVLDFLAAGPEAARRTKELLKHTSPLPSPELIDFTAKQIAEARCAPEGKMGLEAFFSKAPPAWAARVALLRRSRTLEESGKLIVCQPGRDRAPNPPLRRQRGYDVAVISTPEDADALVRTEADAVAEVPSFLDADAIVDAATSWGADLLHPGYGFLSENAEFVRKVESAGVRFVGPTPESMERLGNKESAKTIAGENDVPTLVSVRADELAAIAGTIEPPYLVKAAGGGGGRGMRVVDSVEALPAALARASEEARAGFGDPTVFVERFLAEPRHIEIQVVGDGKGGGVTLGERECSMQRRYQKVIEEAPSPAVDETLRKKMGVAALKLVAATNYRGAGTVEFLLDTDGAFYFLEVNTRLQVEHPVTEAIYDVDLVAAQLEIAEGSWPARLDTLAPSRWAIEARVLAEDPRADFLPTPGPLVQYREPSGLGIRVDSGVAQGGRVRAQFDSMIAKVIATGETRAEAIERLESALADFIVHGVTTNLPFLQAVLHHPDFREGRFSTAWIGKHLDELNRSLLPANLEDRLDTPGFREQLSFALRGDTNTTQAAVRFRSVGNALARVGSTRELEPVDVDCDPVTGRVVLSGPGLTETVEGVATALDPTVMALTIGGETLRLEDPRASSHRRLKLAASDGEVRAPMAGKVLEIHVAEGESVAEGEVLMVVESMKMQLEVHAPIDGIVESITVEEGQVLDGPDLMAVISCQSQSPATSLKGLAAPRLDIRS